MRDHIEFNKEIVMLPSESEQIYLEGLGLGKLVEFWNKEYLSIKDYNIDS
jgi:hypothetical protein